MLYKVYILYSVFRNKYYIGSTCDVMSERLRRHNSNHKGFTGTTPDWVVVYITLFETKTEALSFEKKIKNWKSRKMIEKLIGDNVGSEHPDLKSGGTLIRIQ